MIFDDATLQKLRQLSLIADRIRPGIYRGERRSTRRGSSIEFADYRDYTPGDDLRKVDWNIYARLNRPFLKLMEEEEDLAVHIWIDSSGSMNWGSQSAHKFTFALRLGAALGVVALQGGDRLSVQLVQSHGPITEFGPVRGLPHLVQMLRFMENAAPAGLTDLNASLRAYAIRPRRPGLGFLISDLLSPSGFQRGVDSLLSKGYELVLLHCLAPQEIAPELSGELRLIDIETGQPVEVSATQGLLRRYQDHLERWKGEIRSFCGQRQLRVVEISTDQQWDRVVMFDLRRMNVLK